MFDKLVFDFTPYHSVRVWMYFDETNFHQISNSKEAKGFDYLCSWGGVDKRESGLLSWELDSSLIPFFAHKYAFHKSVDVTILQKIINNGMKI